MSGLWGCVCVAGGYGRMTVLGGGKGRGGMTSMTKTAPRVNAPKPFNLPSRKAESGGGGVQYEAGSVGPEPAGAPHRRERHRDQLTLPPFSPFDLLFCVSWVSLSSLPVPPGISPALWLSSLILDNISS